MTHRCREKQCAKRFSLKTGTVMEGSKFGFQAWVIATYLMCDEPEVGPQHEAAPRPGHQPALGLVPRASAQGGAAIARIWFPPRWPRSSMGRGTHTRSRRCPMHVQARRSVSRSARLDLWRRRRRRPQGGLARAFDARREVEAVFLGDVPRLIAAQSFGRSSVRVSVSPTARVCWHSPDVAAIRRPESVPRRGRRRSPPRPESSALGCSGFEIKLSFN